MKTHNVELCGVRSTSERALCYGAVDMERQMGMLVKHMTPREIECGMCGDIDNHDHPDDRKAVPILNGEPTTSNGECDGYKAVCAKCYNRWYAWDERMKRSNAALTRRP